MTNERDLMKIHSNCPSVSQASQEISLKCVYNLRPSIRKELYIPNIFRGVLQNYELMVAKLFCRLLAL